MTDILLFQTNDGGEINVENGEPEMTDLVESAAFLSLFGGNSDDPGLTGNTGKQYWGNLLETDEAAKLRSQTQYLLRTLPPTSGNLRRIEDAMKSDLGWMVSSLGASISVAASIPTLGRVSLAGAIEIDGKKSPFNFDRAWNR